MSAALNNERNADMTVNRSTVARNVGGGVAGNTALTYSTIVGNTEVDVSFSPRSYEGQHHRRMRHGDSSEPAQSGGFNVVQLALGCSGFGATDIIGANPNLDPFDTDLAAFPLRSDSYRQSVSHPLASALNGISSGEGSVAGAIAERYSSESKNLYHLA